MSTATILPAGFVALSSLDNADGNCVENAVAFGVLPNSVAMSGAATFGDSMVWPVASTLWTSALYNTNGIGSGGNYINGQIICKWFNGATVVAQIVGVSIGSSFNANLSFQTLQSGTMTEVGQITLQLFNGPNIRLDIKLVGGATGACQVYVSGVLRINGSPNHSGWAGITNCRPQGFNLGTNYWSMIWDSVTHIGDNWYRAPLDTVSAVNVGWTGAVTNINQLTTNDNNFVSATANNQISTYFANGWAALNGMTIVAVIVAGRMQPGSTLNNCERAIRTGSANFVSPPINLPSAGFQGTCYPWVNNPNTGIAWTAAQAQAAEAGQVALT